MQKEKVIYLEESRLNKVKNDVKDLNKETNP